MIYVINFFQAGANKRASAFSGGMISLTFETKIDFNYIRKQAKKIVFKSIVEGNPILDLMHLYFSVVRIENDVMIGGFVGSVKFTNILKWKSK